jgi:biopolymer transport protein ExbD
VSQHAGFRRRGALHQWQGRFGPNMTPMVDVVMVILIFFMASTALMGPEWFLKASVQNAAAKATPPKPTDDPFALGPARFVFELTVQEGRTLAKGPGLENATLGRLGERLKAFATEVPPKEALLVLSPAPDVPYQDVVTAHDLCVRAGFERIGLVEPKPVE